MLVLVNCRGIRQNETLWYAMLLDINFKMVTMTRLLVRLHQTDYFTITACYFPNLTNSEHAVRCTTFKQTLLQDYTV